RIARKRRRRGAMKSTAASASRPDRSRCTRARGRLARSEPLLASLELAPTSATVVGDDLFEHRGQRSGFDLVSLVDGDHPRRLVAVASCDDSFWVGDDRAVAEEEVDVVFGGEQRADGALEHEVGLNGALDRLDDLGVGAVDEFTESLANLFLPFRELADVHVDARVALVCSGGAAHSQSPTIADITRERCRSGRASMYAST